MPHVGPDEFHPLLDRRQTSELTRLIGELDHFLAINPAGAIVGFSATTGNDPHATLWTIK